MACEKLNTSLLMDMNAVLSSTENTSVPVDSVSASNITGNHGRQQFTLFLKTTLVPIICVFGMLGNILTLLVLTRKRLKVACDSTERTVHIGLTALAVSDLVFCVCLLPHGLLGKDAELYTSRSFELFYRAYASAIINTFILTSTWLTVVMATSRYLAICHPFRARHIIGIKGTKASVISVYIIAALFNIPKIFENKISSMCINGQDMYFSDIGYLTKMSTHAIYIWVYFTLGIFIPLIVLAFCNICLVRALHESSKIRRRYRVPAAHVDSNHRITSILVTIVVMYILLVSPAEILQFLEHRLVERHTDIGSALTMTVELTNVLQNINFSCNFVLYFVLNVQFRHAMKDLFRVCSVCPCSPEKRRHQIDHRFNRQISMKTTTQTTL